MSKRKSRKNTHSHTKQEVPKVTFGKKATPKLIWFIRNIIPMFLFPIITFYLFEWYTHNPWETMKIRIQFLNIFFFELVMVIFLMVFGKLKAALITETALFMVYGLANYSQGLGFYNLNSDQNIAANCAYIVLKPQEVTQVRRVAFIFDGEDIPTAIDKAETGINANATAVYGVAGEQRSALRRGINIVRMSDGTVRKVAVK